MTIAGGAWSPAKADMFEAQFLAFTKHVKINSKEGVMILGDNLFEAQRRFLKCVLRGLQDDVHDFKVLKSRQLGISTMTRALSIFWLGVHQGLQGAMVFDTTSHREEARNEIMTMLRDLPAKLKFPVIQKDSRDLLTLSNGSTLRFLHAGVRNSKSSGTLGRSSGLNFCHASEMCSWNNEEGVESFKNSLSNNYNNRLYIWESTARGFNQWYEMWEDAKKDDLTQRTCFLGWWSKDIQRYERGTPMFERYGTPEKTAKEIETIEAVKEQYDWEISDEQLAWYRHKTNPTLGSSSGEDTFVDNDIVIQEQPSTEQEAFLMTGSSFFASDKLTEMAKNSSEEYKAFQFNHGNDFFLCDFYPAVRSKDTHLKVWEDPDDNGVYVLAADPAYGHDEKNNHSAFQVLRCYADGVEQVAEYAFSGIETQPFAWVIMAVCGWYKQVYLMLELNGPGEAVWNGIKELKQTVSSGYRSQEAEDRGLRDVFSNVRNYMYVRSDSQSPIGSCFHWKTSTQLKVSIMERMRDCVSNGSLVVRSSETIQEMRGISRDGDSIGADGLNRDDRTFCLAMAIKYWDQSIRRSLSVQGRTKAVEKAKKTVKLKDQIAMFNNHTLDSFFKKKQTSRVMQHASQMRQKWRGK